MHSSKDHPRDVVVVTGSSGFIGSAVVVKLAERFRVVGFDSEGSTHPPAVAECVCVDVTSDEHVDAAMKRLRVAYGDRIASVIHLAAYFDLTGKPNPKYEEVTVRGTERLLRAFQAFELEQFVFVSTMLVHAPGKHGEPINEDSPLDPKLPYRESKIRTEQLIREQRGKVPAVLLRPAGVYDDQCHSAFLAHQIARINERRLISHLYSGDLDTGQPFLHLDDLTEALLQVIEHRAELPAELPLLVGESEAMSFGEVQRELGRLIHGETWQTREVPKAVARTGAWVENEVLEEDAFIQPWMVDISDDRYELDTSRARKLLGWMPRRSLRETLPIIVGALKRDPEKWYRTNHLNAAKVAAQSVEAKTAQSAVKEDKSADPVREHEKMREHMQGMRKMHFDMLWVHYLNLLLGAWLIGSPLVFGSFGQEHFSEAVLRVTQERGLWAPELRAALTGWSDIISGVLIMLFSAMSLSPRLSWAQWANATMGVWLLLAPLIFWTPSAAVYANDTLIGALVITFAILVPMMPGMSMQGMMDESDLPIGWTYSPSTYLQRLPIIALGAIGLLIARHLAAYQLGHIDAAWEPFFSGSGGRNGTETIITSDVSKAWPVADGGLGAVAYTFEVLMGVMGGRQRWRTMPWMVAMFGIVVVPLGVISIYFIIIQPIIIGPWCSLCLLAGLAMLIMIPYTLDELVAMCQFMAQSMRRGEPFWRTFFQGGAQPQGGRDDQPGFDAPLADAARSAARGVTVHWTLILSVAIGVWLMFTRLIFGTTPPIANSDHLVGALIVTTAVIAMAEVGRALRFINIAFGLWLVAAPWLLSGASVLAAWSSVAAGIAVVALSLPRGKRSAEHYGSWDRFIV
jgi:nucleoside-diphosphate-sugar epimerase